MNSLSKKLVLASGSPRRKMLLEAVGLRLIVRPVDVDETPLADEAPEALARRLALKKARASSLAPQEVVLTADTMVAFAGNLLGKPIDDDDAKRMLCMLSGREHEVWTAFCVRDEAHEEVHAVCTHVQFRELHDDEINAYVASGEPRDKAGAYGIQGGGGALVEQARGSYPNVVGLPVKEVLSTLRAFGIAVGVVDE
ncbi:MAG: septum formation inhibitor Maf [Deltaproteobacteria bacterium]|nr:septum formation inhibitor Maf [Deltaproteobacteria bacterium]